jgi:DNA-binding MarR family transcriptional regulator
MCRVTTTNDQAAAGISAAVERILVGGVGVTTLALNEAPEAVELTLAQWRVLAIVAQRDGVRIGELAGRLGIGVPSASRLVRRLERHGLATAERDERDRRATLVRASGEGRRVREGVLRRRGDLIAGALAGRVEHVSADTRAALDEIGACLERFA